MLNNVAHAYLNAGLCVLPAIRAEKRPAIGAWKRYQDRLPTEAELSAWFNQPHDALCILCGSVSNQLEMIDFDAKGELFLAWLDRIPHELANRLFIEDTPSGGMHVVYRSVDPVCGSFKLAQRKTNDRVVTLIETRGQGGLFLCSPTPGYEHIQGDLTNLPVLTTDERDILLQAAWGLNEYQPPVVDQPVQLHVTPDSSGSNRPGDDYNRRTDPRNVLQQHGWTLAKSGENEYWRRPGKNTGWSATLKDGVFYVFSANASPFESNRAYAPFAIYTLLEHGGDYAKAASALRTQGYGSSTTTPLQGANLEGITLSPPALDDLEPICVEDLVVTYPTLRPPIIHGLLREGETMNLISAPKMGKSWLVTDLALAIATGSAWLDQYPCEQGDVLILDNELHAETSSDRIPKVGNARNIPMSAYGRRVRVLNLRGRLYDIFSLGSFFQRLHKGQYKVIILDAFYRFMPRDMDENDNGTMASLYNQIDRYADELGCSFVLIHHTTKGNQSAKSVTDVGAGAGSQSRATDTHVILRPHEEEDVMVMDAAVRSWPPISPFCLRREFPIWMPADDLDPHQLRAEPGKKRSEKQQDAWTTQIFTETFITDTPTTRTAIFTTAMQAGLSEYRTRILLRQAEAEGLVLRLGAAKRNQPCEYVRGSAASNTSQSQGNQP